MAKEACKSCTVCLCDFGIYHRLCLEDLICGFYCNSPPPSNVSRFNFVKLHDDKV